VGWNGSRHGCYNVTWSQGTKGTKGTKGKGNKGAQEMGKWHP